MIDREEQPPPDLARERHDAVVRRDDDSAQIRSDVDASVAGAVRIGRRIEATDDRPDDGPRPRHRRVGSGHRRRETTEREQTTAQHTTDHTTQHAS